MKVRPERQGSSKKVESRLTGKFSACLEGKQRGSDLSEKPVDAWEACILMVVVTTWLHPDGKALPSNFHASQKVESVIPRDSMSTTGDHSSFPRWGQQAFAPASSPNASTSQRRFSLPPAAHAKIQRKRRKSRLKLTGQAGRSSTMQERLARTESAGSARDKVPWWSSVEVGARGE